MRVFFAIGMLVLVGGCSSFHGFKSTKPPAASATVEPPIHQSATTRYIEAERAQMAKTHVEGAYVR